MRVLALDTTTRAGSVAVVEDERIVAERRGDDSRTHAERLPAEITALLESRGLALADVDRFAVAIGPGSFTGLRIGIATIQGLAFVTERSIVGVSALEALAQIASGPPLGADDIVAAWIDAHRREVFSALYRVMTFPLFDAGRLREIEAPAVGDPAATLTQWANRGHRPSVFVGDGATIYKDVIDRIASPQARIVEAPLLAGAIGRMAVARAVRGEAAPEGIRPLYVRRPDAEIAREAKR